jgi:hypothetical protein
MHDDHSLAVSAEFGLANVALAGSGSIIGF